MHTVRILSFLVNTFSNRGFRVHSLRKNTKKQHERDKNKIYLLRIFARSVDIQKGHSGFKSHITILCTLLPYNTPARP